MSRAIATAGDLKDAIYDTWALLCVEDATGEILLANRAAEVLFGYDDRPGSMVGLAVEELLPPDPPGLRARHPGLRASFYAAPSTRWMCPVPVRAIMGWRKGGPAFEVEVTLTPWSVYLGGSSRKEAVTVVCAYQPVRRFGAASAVVGSTRPVV